MIKTKYTLQLFIKKIRYLIAVLIITVITGKYIVAETICLAVIYASVQLLPQGRQ